MAIRENAPPKQLAFDLPADPRYGREDFLVGPANAAAYGLVEAWPNWPDTVCVLTGPPGSGKSHLASIWATRAHAWTAAVAEVRAAAVPHLDGLRSALSEAPAVEGLQYLADLKHRWRVTPSDEGRQAGGQGQGRPFFESGRVAFFPNGAFYYAQVRDNARFKWGVAQLPGGKAGRTPGTPPSSTPRPPFAFCSVQAPTCGAKRPATSDMGASSGSLPAASVTVS